MSAEIHECHWRDLPVERCDLLCVDAPYSARTHTAYRDMAEVGRRSLAYAAWTTADVSEFVASWAPRTNGWFVSLTDHVLAPAWEEALNAHGRYTFAPLACMEPGSRVRLSGDGPAQWSCLAVVARPRTRAAQKWGALPGGYVIPASHGWRGTVAPGGRSGVVGGKPLWLMERLIEDYSRPGDLVVDPCCGAATTGVAALRHGRRFIGGDMMPEHVALAREAIAAELELSTVSARKAGQVPLFGGAA